MDIFSQWLDGLNNILSSSFGFFETETTAIVSGFITLAFMLVGGQVAFGNGNVMGPALAIALRSGAVLAMLSLGRYLGEWVTAGASAMGAAMGGEGSINAFLGSPDEIYMLGLTRLTDLFSLANRACEVHYLGCVGNLQGYLPASAAGYVVAICFFIISLAVFSVTVLFKLGFVVGIILFPAVVFGPAAFIGWPFIQFLVHFFVQIVVLSAVTSFGSRMFENYAVGVNPGIESTIDVLSGSGLFLCVVLSSILIAKALSGQVVGDHGMIARAAGAVGGQRHVERVLNSVRIEGGGHGGASEAPQLQRGGGSNGPGMNIGMNAGVWTPSSGGAGAWRHGGTGATRIQPPVGRLPRS